LLFLSALGIGLGWWGFSKQGNSFSDSLYETLRLFHLYPKDNMVGWAWQLQWAKWITLAAFFWATFKLFFEIIAPKWLHSAKQYLYYSKRYMFMGAGEQAKILAQDLLKKPCHCIFLLPKEKYNDVLIFNEFDYMRIVVLYTNFERSPIKFPKRVDKFFFVEEDENFNMEMAARLLEQLKSKPPTKEISIYVKTEFEQYYPFIQNELKNCKNIEFHIFNPSDLTARLFVKEHPMLDSPNIEIDHEKLLVKGKFNLLLIGFGWQGKELLKKCICDSQFVGSSFRATIIDKDYETNYGDYSVFYDECIEEYNLQFETKTIGSVAFYKWLNHEIYHYNRIIIASGNDNINIDIAEKITKILQTHRISNTQKIVFAHVQKLKSYSDNFTVFGKLLKIYIEEMIVHEKMDIIAKFVGYVYNRDGIVDTIDWEQAEKEWKDTKAPILFNKDSNRAVGANIENIKRIAGKSILELNDKELNIIAENEHLRWNAFHFVNGIRKLNLNEIETENAKQFGLNNNLLKHGCLVPFSDLHKVSEKVNKIREQNGTMNKRGKADYIEADRRIVQHIPLFFKEIEQLKNRNQ